MIRVTKPTVIIQYSTIAHAQNLVLALFVKLMLARTLATFSASLKAVIRFLTYVLV